MIRRMIRRIIGRGRSPSRTSTTPVRRPPPPSRVPPAPARSAELVLYKYDSCPYCRRVMQVVDRLHISVRMADIRQDPAARDHLYQQTGRHTVPCLFIDGEPLFESADIISWLESQAGQQLPP